MIRRAVLPALILACLTGASLWATDEEAASDEKWSVTDPAIEGFYPVEIDTTSGTWMNLDLSPDGRTLVFDLLGDLYTVPIEGGDARALTRGLAWDMQPSFSPDGQSVVFTSDRGGGDNVWILDLGDASLEGLPQPREISREKHRLLNNPVFSPDGQFVAARKHFSSTRSLGSGEIWLFHTSGTGSGLQLNEKPNDQKDLGEPAFSPDGRYVYFSQDTTPGGTFEYSKDSTGRIYSIHRIDRETGEIDTVISGNGGAVRPTPSPDGKWLAFVRRERFQSKLFLHDLESGRNTVIYDRLDRDMQEIWAIHGVYPTMAWTPDSRELVFWAGGKIHRVDIETTTEREIPFRVRQTHTLREALRFPVEVHPERFRTRMLRWVEVSPDGDRALFQALGRIWLRDFATGETRPLTTQKDHFELHPSWSRDGSQIVYVSWSDQELGAVRIAPATGGSQGRVVTTRPGHYAEPTLSPSGRYLVYRQVRGNNLTGALWSRDPGIYAVDLQSDREPVRIHRSGLSPHFGASENRVFFMEVESWNERFLRSLTVSGSLEEGAGEMTVREHAKSEVATEMRVSPDGRWLAFVERFRAYAAPFPASAKAISVGPKMDGLPVRQLSDDAGAFLHWSGDSETVYWSLGPELLGRRLDQTFPFLGANDEESAARSAPIDLGFEVPSDVPSGTIALTGGRILTMTGDDASGGDVIERGTVVVRDNRIVAVGATGSVDVPSGARVIDVTGRTVLPGLIDVHWHGPQGSNGVIPQQNYENDAGLAFGVTTVHDPSNDTQTFFAAAEMARAGLVRAPRLFSTGTILYGANGASRAIIESVDDARMHLKRLQAAGAISAKSYNQPRRDQRQMIVAAANELGMMVVNEGGALFNANMTMVADGHTGIEHSLSVGAIYDDVIQFWGQSRGKDGGIGVGNTPTLGVAFGGIEGERYWYQHTNVWENERLVSFVPQDEIDARSRRRMMAPDSDYNHFNTARIVKQLNDAGVSIQLGAHGQREGLAAHWELWMFEQGGMTPMEALRAGTINGARYLGMDGDIGSLAPGKLADLIVIAGNPLENLRSSEAVLYTMVNGRLYESATLDEIAPGDRKRQPYSWQED